MTKTPRDEPSIRVSGASARLAAQLRAARLQQGLTQKALADRFGGHSSYVSQWECNLAVPGVAALNQWAGGLGLELTLSPIQKQESPGLGALAVELQAATADANHARASARAIQDTWMDYPAETRNALTERLSVTQTRLCAAQDAWTAAGLALAEEQTHE